MACECSVFGSAFNLCMQNFACGRLLSELPIWFSILLKHFKRIISSTKAMAHGTDAVKIGFDTLVGISICIHGTMRCLYIILFFFSSNIIPTRSQTSVIISNVELLAYHYNHICCLMYVCTSINDDWNILGRPAIVVRKLCVHNKLADFAVFWVRNSLRM